MSTARTIGIALATGAAAAVGGILVSRLFSSPRDPQQYPVLLGEFGEVRQVVTNYGVRLGDLDGRVGRLERRVAQLEGSRSSDYAMRDQAYQRGYQQALAAQPPRAPAPPRAPSPDSDPGMVRLLRELSRAPEEAVDVDPVTRRFQLLEVD